MAQHTIDHTCGHSQTHNLYGPHVDRDRKEAWLQNTVCSDCYREAQDSARSAENASAAEANQAAGLPALVGSEKQIAWAESIRKPICEALSKFEADFKPHPDLSESAAEELGDAVALLVDEIRLKTECRWWIDVAGEAGTGFDLRNADEARVYCLGNAQKRGLIPLAIQEFATIDARKKAEAEEQKKTQAALVAELVEAYPSAVLTYETATQGIAGTIGAHAIHYDGHGINGKVTVDGTVIREPGRLRSLLMQSVSDLQSERRKAARDSTAASLAGLTVASVAKKKQELKVTLSDGRILHGQSTREGWWFDKVGRDSIDPNHPEPERLAVDANAWAKVNGVK